MTVYSGALSDRLPGGYNARGMEAVPQPGSIKSPLFFRGATDTTTLVGIQSAAGGASDMHSHNHRREMAQSATIDPARLTDETDSEMATAKLNRSWQI